MKDTKLNYFYSALKKGSISGAVTLSPEQADDLADLLSNLLDYVNLTYPSPDETLIEDISAYIALLKQ
jgi:hypothetical protein